MDCWPCDIQKKDISTYFKIAMLGGLITWRSMIFEITVSFFRNFRGGMGHHGPGTIWYIIYPWDNPLRATFYGRWSANDLQQGTGSDTDLNHLPDFAAEQWIECLLAPGPVSRSQLEGGLTVEFNATLPVLFDTGGSPPRVTNRSRTGWSTLISLINQSSPWTHCVYAGTLGSMNQKLSQLVKQPEEIPLPLAWSSTKCHAFGVAKCLLTYPSHKRPPPKKNNYFYVYMHINQVVMYGR